jgi:hypothetical protein
MGLGAGLHCAEPAKLSAGVDVFNLPTAQVMSGAA